MEGVPAWQLPCCLWQMILHRHPAVMFPATDDNGMLHLYWPVSCYRCAFPSCRSPRGTSSCLRLLISRIAPRAHTSVFGGDTESQPSQFGPFRSVSTTSACQCLGLEMELIYNCHTLWGSIATAKHLLMKVPFLSFAFDFPKVSFIMEVFSSQD